MKFVPRARLVPKPILVVVAGALIAAAATLPAGAAGTLVDVAGQAGIARTEQTWSANVADFNNDGRQDFLYIRHYPHETPNIPRPILYRNTGGAFTPFPVPWNSADRHDCAWGDASQDGRIDLFCTNGLVGTSPNEMWIQRADGSFVREAPPGWGELNRPVQGRARTATMFQANGDGYLDLFVNRFNKRNAEDFGNTDRFYLNSRNDTWLNAPEWGLNEEFGTQHGYKTCNDNFDFNSDGKEDLLLCPAGTMKLFQNTGTRFVNVADNLNIGGRWLDAEIRNLDDAGRPDLFRINQDKLEVRLATANGFSLSQSFNVGQGVNAVSGDYDGDGDLDIYAQRGCTGAPLDRSTSDQADWVLANNGSGRFAIAQQLAGTPRGCGQSVERIDYNNDGDADFLVLNGRQNSDGPVQLFTYR
jgi:hypothetical protein